MKKILFLKNKIRHYVWGSETAIPDLIGIPPAPGKPCAELWMGAHPGAPSQVNIDGEWKSLGEWIATNPSRILGEKVARGFSNTLPYLFKVLAAGKPLSVQAHPDAEQAEKGFLRENRLNIPIDAPHRNYRDNRDKPEIICALTPFIGMCGFRNLNSIAEFLEILQIRPLSREIEMLRRKKTGNGLRIFFQTLMTMPVEKQKWIVAEAVKKASEMKDEDPVFEWMVRLNTEFGEDIGVLSPLILNLVELPPGTAMFLPPRTLHAYLDGLGIELMANSDNVLRGGLTKKHVDVPELLRVLRFDEYKLEKIDPKKKSSVEHVFDCPAKAFRLSVVETEPENNGVVFWVNGIEILLCVEGKAIIRVKNEETGVEITKGGSVVISAETGSYLIEGTAKFFKASVPDQENSDN